MARNMTTTLVIKLLKDQLTVSCLFIRFSLKFQNRNTFHSLYRSFFYHFRTREFRYVFVTNNFKIMSGLPIEPLP